MNNFCAAGANYQRGSSLITRGIDSSELDEKKSAREKFSTSAEIKKVSSQKSAREIKIAQLLANSETAQKTDQIILVIGNERQNAKGLLSFWNKNFRGEWECDFEVDCGYGTNGLSSNRYAGDKTTPIGSFPLLYAFGLVDNPGTSMTYRKITPRSYLSSEPSTYPKAA